MRWMILGAAGQLGQALMSKLGDKGIPVTRSQADLTVSGSLEKILDNYKPYGVINCAAYNWVDKAEDQSAEAFMSNCWAAGHAADQCAKKSIPFVQISTDHVFGTSPSQSSNAAHNHWLETDSPLPVSIYALSKLSGEHLVRMRNNQSWIIRTCGLYGRHGTGGKGTNFVETMLRLALEGKNIRVVSDQTCTPTPAAELAPAILELIEKKSPGLYHLTSGGYCTWHEFAQAIFDAEGLPIRVQSISSSEFGAKAQRPSWSVLGSVHKGHTGMPEIAHWREGLRSYLKERRQAG